MTGRRRLLALTGFAVASAWVKPVVEVVVINIGAQSPSPPPPPSVNPLCPLPPCNPSPPCLPTQLDCRPSQP